MIMNGIKYSYWIAGFYMLTLAACRTPQQGLFSKKTPHENYRAGLEQAGLSNTRLGLLWVTSAQNSLNKPINITLPYKETGYFEMGVPGAIGYVFSAKQGERVLINVASTLR